MKNKITYGFTLIELMVAIGLFASIMTIAASAYLTMIRVSQQAQAISTGIDNVSFALESMTRDIRSGSAYGCGQTPGINCPYLSGGGGGGGEFTFTDANGNAITYKLASGSIQEQKGISPTWVSLTDPSVTITSLVFYVSGVGSYSTTGDTQQPYVTIIVSGSVPSSPGRAPQPFTVESSAAWRGSDI